VRTKITTLADLDERVKKLKETAANRQKAGYQLARELGLSSYEAMALQNSNEDTIRGMAAKRKAKES
jgi:DNA-binding Xre family transcriptional regulator